MLENWLLEFLLAMGRFFIHPLVYFFLIYSLVLGFIRIKRERKSFHTRIQDIYEEVRFTYSKGLMAGLLLSAVTFGLGVMIPLGSIVLLAIVTVILSLTFQLRFLTPAYTMGLTIFAAFFLMQTDAVSFLPDLNETSFSILAIVMGLLLIAEGVLAYRTAHLKTSPFLLKSSRGLPIGNHVANRTWLLPLFLLIPGGSLTESLSWWPVLTIGDEPFLFVFIPYIIGFHQRVQGSLPKESIMVTSKRVMWLGLIISAAAAVSVWFMPLAFAAALLAIIGREFLTVRQRMNDNSAAFYFSKRDHGLMVLGILPHSPAVKLELEVGEIIMKTNGASVKTVDEFYQALQINGAFCKMEVIGLNGEIRYVQGAIYKGEHHELGILFVQDEKKWGTEAV
ncbi:cell division protein [Metabacillus idriensis]|uniref:cell division protein n=1 Tax=Metabacillus idriensis TaxID=324768 RepID=UPI003D2D8B17